MKFNTKHGRVCRIKGKTPYGKAIVKAHGNKWTILNHNEKTGTVMFQSQRRTHYRGAGIHTRYLRWIDPKNQPHFLIS
jgi:hypothetical protein